MAASLWSGPSSNNGAAQATAANHDDGVGTEAAETEKSSSNATSRISTSFLNSNVAIVTSWAKTAPPKAVHSGKWVDFRRPREND